MDVKSERKLELPMGSIQPGMPASAGGGRTSLLCTEENSFPQNGTALKKEVATIQQPSACDSHTITLEAKGFKKAIGRVCFLMVFLVALLAHLPQANAEQLILEQQSGWHAYNRDVTIHPITMNGESAGHSIWLSRSSGKVKAKYFASEHAGNVYHRYSQWSQGKNVILFCSVGWVNRVPGGDMLPIGITVDNGTIVNRNRDSLMDGLVIVLTTGGIVVSDIEKQYLTINPVDSSPFQVDLLKQADLNKMLRWAEADVATIFQTQLLAYENRLRLIVSDARKRKRERRILVLGRQSGQVQHIIFNILPGVYLGDIAEGILRFLKGQGQEVVAMLNFDAGINDILRVNLDVPVDIRGPVDPSKAPNLLVYYYDE